MIKQEKLFKLNIDTKEGGLSFQHICQSEEAFIEKVRNQIREAYAWMETNYPKPKNPLDELTLNRIKKKNDK
jgi:hypothetical protein